VDVDSLHQIAFTEQLGTFAINNFRFILVVGVPTEHRAPALRISNYQLFTDKN
jgi:hypothetical protein